ncbi:putative membrane protein [Sphaerochaeta pleomorpha str. Grapes]|uniref:Putative membrane protein n=1 Tax=Sphaerochaeta pleomorpha (strain ATCC BAA-1885 / DSM 22778 / Grapes) TaxID=158190 RepID=G8QYK6_SPHPG|nr:SHOCT domain-containing protein [Sphaerochaeta pleomorpha]AEV28569.1 putative membrane protein [Sphaerochaeta pleomorpha str. Grapes]
MKKTVAFLACILLLCIVPLGAEVIDYTQSTQLIVQKIMDNQGVSTIKQIDPDKVSDAQLERLGDAVMGILIPDEQQHAWMDQMMGGEGSLQLAAKHKWIAYSYLKNDGNLTSAGWGSEMLGSGMMMSGWNNAWYGINGMRGWPLWSGILVFLLVAGIIFLAIVLSIRFFTPGGFSKRGKKASETETPLSILKQRYAKGEITKEEFLEMKETLLK